MILSIREKVYKYLSHYKYKKIKILIKKNEKLGTYK